MNRYLSFDDGVTCIFIIRCYQWLVENLITGVIANLLSNYELILKIVDYVIKISRFLYGFIVSY